MWAVPGRVTDGIDYTFIILKQSHSKTYTCVYGFTQTISDPGQVPEEVLYSAKVSGNLEYGNWQLSSSDEKLSNKNELVILEGLNRFGAVRVNQGIDTPTVEKSQDWLESHASPSATNVFEIFADKTSGGGTLTSERQQERSPLTPFN